MIRRWGIVEMTRLTAEDSRLDDTPDYDRLNRALDDAEGIINGYLRVRLALPLPLPVPPELERAACILARYDLGHGEARTPSEQMKTQRDEILAWLRDVAKGLVVLDAIAAPINTSAGAMTLDREPALRLADGLIG
ncbi:phage protein Gp36 family protein [Humitalea sp. 24SJ18S-53]|uniref:phage protein Gp36 family protein n=1 Tax=Humitalea sp. 24SJ18S-53 TaxID=3422307 RepID=UPI003D66DE67